MDQRAGRGEGITRDFFGRIGEILGTPLEQGEAISLAPRQGQSPLARSI